MNTPSEQPYRIMPPALISFSGGRTSGFMLRQILDAHNGSVPAGVHVVFANTGRERPQTLDFVRECGERWGLPIVWLEYRDDDAGFAVVDHATASRDGEPFAALIRQRKFLPNAVSRFCTTELKVRPMKRWMIARGYEQWDSVLGLRADEPNRVHRASLSSARERWHNLTPMARAGHTLADVMAFWAAQPFDLGLQQHEGNCDLCFLKRTDKLLSIICDNPELADWWIRHEQEVGGTFNKRRSYTTLLRILEDDRRQMSMFNEFDETELACNCTD